MKHRVLHLTLPITALLAAACSDPAAPDAENELGAVTGMPDGTEEPATPGGEAEPAGAQGWEITSAGFGPFDPSTPYSGDAIAAALPGYQLAESELESEGMPYPVTMAAREGAENPLIVVAAIPGSDAIFAVAVREEGLVSNALGEIGETYAEAGFSGVSCWPGAEERSGDVVCFDPRNPAVGYWLDPAGYAGPDGELPPPDVLDQAVIYEIRWTPPAG